MSLSPHLPAVFNPALSGFSAWSNSTVPPLVRTLEEEFLLNLRNHLQASETLSEESIHKVQNLLDADAPAREVADVLFLAQGEDWCRRERQKFGDEAVSWTPHDARRLFQPFPGKEPNPGGLDPSFLQKLGALPRGADAVLEIRCTIDVALHSIPAAFGFSSLNEVLAPMGFAVLNHWESDEFTIRVPSISLVERSAALFLGNQAARYCVARGPLPERELNALQKRGYRVVGNPLTYEYADVSYAHPFAYAAHDLGHGLLWSLNVPIRERAMATLFFEALKEFEDESDPAGEHRSLIQDELSTLLDLEMAVNRLERLVERVGAKLPGKDFDAVMTRYRALLYEAARDA